MRFELTRTGESLVTVLGGFSVGRVSLLEGLNGIGKSSAIRLLLVGTGQRPYPRGARAWSSFRRGMGVGSMTVSGLQDGQTISWSFDSLTWPESSREPVSDEWFTSIMIDGKSSTLRDVQAVLHVERISGDIGLLETFKEDLHLSRDEFNDAAHDHDSRLRQVGSGDTKALRQLAAVVNVGQGISAEYLTRAHEDEARSRALVEDLQSQLTADLNSVANFERARDVRESVQRAEDVGPSLADALAAAESEVLRLEGERSRIHNAIDEMSELVARTSGEAAQQKLLRAKKNRDKNETLLDSAREQVADALAALGLSDDESDRIAERDRCIQEIVTKQATALEIDQTPALIDLGKRVEEELTADKSLMDKPILPTSFASDPSAVGLASALREQHEHLAALPAVPGAEQLRVQIRELEERLQKLDAIPPLLQHRQRLADLVVKHSDTIADLTQRPEVELASSLNALRTERSEIEDLLSAAISNRARFRRESSQLLEAGSLSALRDTLAGLVDDLGVTVGTLETAHTQKVSEVSAVRISLQEEQLRKDEAKKRGDLLRDSIHTAARRFETEPEFKWLRELAPGSRWSVEDGVSDSDAALASQIERVSTTATGAIARLESLSGSLLAAGAALDVVARRLEDASRSEPASDDGRMFLPQVLAWAAEHLGHYFERPSIRDLLLDADASDIKIDIDDASVTWSSQGQLRTRRLEAFSSGQQAFAFAQARLEFMEMEQLQAANRLICLDEFGAFMDASRRAELLSFLAERSLSATHDSVLLVLPLRRSFADAAAESFGDDVQRYKELDERVRRDLFVVKTSHEPSHTSQSS